MGSDTSSRFVLPALLILCAVLRMFGLGHADFWYDEAYSLAESADLKGILSGELIGSDAPLFLVLLHGWRQLFDGEFALRLLSALFGVLAVAAVYCAAERLINQRTAIVAGTLAAVSPFFIYYAQELRVYSLLAFVTCGSLITLYRATTCGGRKWWAAYGLFSTLGLYAHHFGFFTLAAAGAYFLGFSGVARQKAKPFILTHALVLLAYLPWAPILIDRIGGIGSHFVGMKFSPKWAPLYLKIFAVGHHDIPKVLWIGALLAFCGFAAFGLWTLRTKRREAGLLLCFALVPFALAFAFTLLGPRIFIHRYLIGTAIPVYILVAVGLVRARPTLSTIPATVLGTAIVFSLATLYANGPMQELILFPKKPYGEFADALLRNNRNAENEVVVHVDNCSYLPFYHYTDDNRKIRNARLRKQGECDTDFLPLYQKIGMIPRDLDACIGNASGVWLVLTGWSSRPASEAALTADRDRALELFQNNTRLVEKNNNPIGSSIYNWDFHVRYFEVKRD